MNIILLVCSLIGWWTSGDLFTFGYIVRVAVDIGILVCVNTCSFLLSTYLSLYPDVELSGYIVNILVNYILECL